MDSSFLQSLLAQYHWQASLMAFAGILAASFVGGRLALLVPAFKEAARLNKEAYQEKLTRPEYAANQKWNRKWGLIDWVVIFGLIVPFAITTEWQPWWKMLLDMVVILMFYDFFYYLVHRFLFHKNGFLGGPLVWVHAVHHRQHNPCRMDSSYIHPIEVAMGLGLYAGSIFVLSLLMGQFHVITIVITWIAFSEINLHNHDLWKADRFPFKYLSYAAQMHHNHHARFTGGNYATISLLYDWMFGSLDHGQGWGKNKVKAKAQPAR